MFFFCYLFFFMLHPDIGSEMDEDEMMVSESEDSNDSWTNEEFTAEFIMRYGSRFVHIFVLREYSHLDLN